MSDISQPNAVVRIKNVGDTDFRDGFNGQPYIIPAGQETIVLYDAMCLWLGHPRANNHDPRNRVRVMEHRRLSVRYGVDVRALELSTQGQAVDSDQLFQMMRPKLEVYDMQDQPVITVADDPDGNFLAPPDASTDGGIGLLTARIAQMEAEQKALRNQLAQQQRSEQALNDARPLDALDEDGNPLVDPPVRSDIIGTIEPDPNDPTPPSTAPRAPSRTAPSEDTPNRVRVSGA